MFHCDPPFLRPISLSKRRKRQVTARNGVRRSGLHPIRPAPESYSRISECDISFALKGRRLSLLLPATRSGTPAVARGHLTEYQLLCPEGSGQSENDPVNTEIPP